MKTIAERLKYCPKGMKLYSPMFGCGELFKVTDKDIRVKFPSEYNVKRFRADGKICEDGECMLFPEKGGLNARINQIVLSLLFILSQAKRNVQRDPTLGMLLLLLDLKDVTRIDATDKMYLFN